MKYTNAFTRNVVDVEPEQGKRKATRVRFRAVAKAKDESGKWRQKTANLEAEKATGRNADEKTKANIQIAIDAWVASLNEQETAKDAKTKSLVSVCDVVKTYIDEREAMSARAKWDTGATFQGIRIIGESTIRDYRHTLQALEKSLSNVALDELTLPYIKDWETKQLMGGMSFSRLRKCHILLSQTLQSATDKGMIQANPMAGFKAPYTKWTDEGKGLSRKDMQEVTAKLSMLEPEPHVVGAMIALHAGLRGGEISALRWRDVDLEYRCIKVRHAIGIRQGGAYLKDPKSVSGKRTLWMDEWIHDVLNRRRAKMLQERNNITTDFDDLYVIGNVAGDFLSPTTLSRRWTVLASTWGLKTTGGKKCTLHGLRHSFSTAMRNTKANVGEEFTRMKLMGHSDVQMTEHYGSQDWKSEIPTVMAATEYMRPTDDMLRSTKASGEVLPFPKTGTDG